MVVLKSPVFKQVDFPLGTLLADIPAGLVSRVSHYPDALKLPVLLHGHSRCGAYALALARHYHRKSVLGFSDPYHPHGQRFIHFAFNEGDHAPVMDSYGIYPKPADVMPRLRPYKLKLARIPASGLKAVLQQVYSVDFKAVMREAKEALEVLAPYYGYPVAY